MDSAFVFLDKACKMYEQHPARAKADMTRYITARSNVILTLLHLKRFTKASRLLDGFKEKHFDAAAPALKKKIFQNYYVYYTYIHINTCEFEKGIQLVPGIKEGLEKYDVNAESKIVLFFNISQLYFTPGDFTAARYTGSTEYGMTPP